MSEKVQHLADLLPVIAEISDERCYMTVMDDQGTVMGFSIPKGETPQYQVGDTFVDPSGAYDEVMRTGVKKYNFLPAEVMGEPFEGVLIPIKEAGRTVGVWIYSHSVGEKEEIRNMANEFHDAMEAVTVSINEVINGMEDVVGMLAGMNDNTMVVDEDVKNATQVIQKLSSNASRSNILALNASIEAARSGEAGRGFAVVATEMGKLANDSGSSAKEIGTTLDIISQHLQEMVDSIQTANDTSKGYMEGVSEVKAQLEKTLALAEELQQKLV